MNRTYKQSMQWQGFLGLDFGTPHAGGRRERKGISSAGRQRPKLWIGEDTLDGIALILEEDLYISDYYIVDKKYRWMITCNHHGVCCSWGMGWIWTGLQI